MNLSSLEIAQAVKGNVKGAKHDLIKRVVIDSRIIQAGDLFVAIIGLNHDGHAFLDDAFKKGAVGAIVSAKNISVPSEKFIVEVVDTLKALGDLAHYHSQKLQTKVIAITGSNGKTTTKDLLASVLSESFLTHKSKGNLNNEYGVPLSLLELKQNHQAMVLEMGMRGKGEIAYLAQIAAPKIAIITNIGPAHLERVNDLKGVLDCKAELIEALPSNGTLIYNGDDQLLTARAKQFTGLKIPFGFGDNCLVQGQEIKRLGLNYTVFGAYLDQEFSLFKLPLLGRHNVYNALAALSGAFVLGLPLAKMKAGLLNATFAGMRLEIIEYLKGATIINDCYNSNPSSLKYALEILADISGPNKIAVLGDMLELGKESIKAHRQAGQYAATLGLDWLLLIGTQSKHLAKGALDAGFDEKRILKFKTNQQLAETLKELIEEQDVILIKGSRGMAMEEIVTVLRSELD